MKIKKYVFVLFAGSWIDDAGNSFIADYNSGGSICRDYDVSFRLTF
jgi:hypothetical protein